MPAQSSLLSYLTSKYDAPTENIATEALYYVLTSSPVAHKAMLDYIGQFVTGLPSSLLFQTQDGTKNGGVLDLAGYNAESSSTDNAEFRPRLIIESKFWAGLTDRQPVAYFQELSSAKPSVLLFLAPARRLPTLWPELVKRMEAAKLSLQPVGTVSEVHRIAEHGHHYLMIATWNSVMRYLHDALTTQGDMRTAWDIAQLQGIAEQQDAQAFLPLKSEELTPAFARRILDYCRLVDTCYNYLKTESWVSTKGLKMASGWGAGVYGRYLNIHQHGARLWFTANHWVQYAETPLYLDLGKKGFTGGSKDLEILLAPLVQRQPPGAFPLGKGVFTVPLYPPVGQEFEQVVNDLLSQILVVTELLKPKFGVSYDESLRQEADSALS